MNTTTKAPSLAMRLCALVCAIALVIGTMPVLAHAQEPDGASPAAPAGEVTLSIVNGIGYAGPNAVVNKTYRFAEGATVSDLLSAAVAAGDIAGFAFGEDAGYGSFLESVTLADGTVLANDPGYVTYWASFKNGGYASGTDCQASDLLADGVAIQFAWCDSVPRTAPTSAQWQALADAAAQSDAPVIGGIDGLVPTPPTGTIPDSELEHNQQAVFNALFNNISASIAGAGTQSDRNVKLWYALDLAAIGQPERVDKDAVLAYAQQAYDAPNGTNLQLAALVLASLGVDPSVVSTPSGTIDLIDRMATHELGNAGDPTSLAFTLLAYATGSYEISADAKNAPSKVLSALLSSQTASGGWEFFGAVDPDTTAAAVTALSLYQGNAAAKDACAAALSALKSIQKADGGFGNVNSTAWVVIALVSAGIDPAADPAWTTPDGSTPLSALLANAKADLSGFTADGAFEDLATEQAFRAMVAYQGMKNAGGAYCLYTQAVQGTADLRSDVPPAQGGSDQIVPPNGGDAGQKTPPTTSAKTGDHAGSAAAALCATALVALAVLALAYRRGRFDSADADSVR